MKGFGPARSNVPKGPYPSSSDGVVGYHLSFDASHLGAMCNTDEDEGVTTEMILDEGVVNANADPMKHMRDKVFRCVNIVLSWWVFYNFNFGR